MKHIKNFNAMNEKVENNIKRIANEIEIAIEEFIKNPEKFPKYDSEKLWTKLTKDAKDDNYKGKVSVKISKQSNKFHIVYEPKKSFLQTLGSAAANAKRK